MRQGAPQSDAAISREYEEQQELVSAARCNCMLWGSSSDAASGKLARAALACLGFELILSLLQSSRMGVRLIQANLRLMAGWLKMALPVASPTSKKFLAKHDKQDPSTPRIDPSG